MASSNTYTILLLGDVMLGRLIDQLLPTHVDSPQDASHINNFLSRNPHLKDYDYRSPWGNALPLLKSCDLVLANLETAVTTYETPWPNKVFNYRTHPDNVKSLKEAGVSYVSLANNHTLDFSEAGLFETVRTVREAGIAFAGAGETEQEAVRPARMRLGDREVHVWSFSDHPRDWKDVKQFNYFDYTKQSRDKMKRMIMKEQEGAKAVLKVVSLHWGPNYMWQPSQDIRELARWLIDECEVNIIHGHSSHHVQGVEVYKGRLVVYGCGDFVDDYAVDAKYRNDLSAAWRVSVREVEQEKLEVVKLEVFPNRIKQFQAGLLSGLDEDHKWVRRKFEGLCEDMGTKAESEQGTDGQIVVELERQQ